MVGAFQGSIEGVITLDDLFKYLYNGYTIEHLLRFTLSVPFSVQLRSDADAQRVLQEVSLIMETSAI